MKGYRFYLEYPNQKEKRRATVKEPGKHCGNVIALCLDEEPYLSQGQVLRGCFSAVYERPDSPCCYDSVSCLYLQSHCKRIPEKLAMEIHPNLFYRIEQN